MKKMILVLVSLVFMGCALDESNQEEYQTHYITPRDEVEVIVYVKVYYDENGVQITDPDIIEGIEGL